jgi:methylated-DNA-[protein]-cysteine S-methyltransferase
MRMNNIFYYKTCLGIIGVADNGKALTDLFFTGTQGLNSCFSYKMLPDRGEETAAYTTQSNEMFHIDIQNVIPAVKRHGVTEEAAESTDMTAPTVKETSLIREAAFQLSEYLAGKRKTFDIPLDIKGTPFQLAVWKALLDIPYGETRSYKEIAESIGRAKACRAVGMACNRNPVAIIVPCHRVIGTDGSMTGFASGVNIKEKLLELEKRHRNHRNA